MPRGKKRTNSDNNKSDDIQQKKNKPEEEKKNKEEFSWSDDEIQLLLTSALDFKAQCEFEGISWESKRSKYEQIFDILMKQYPTIEDIINYPNKQALTKDRITAKLKSIRTGFKKAADAGRKSGGGRVVFTFYNLCESLWGGSPAVTSLPFGVDTSGEKENDQSDAEDMPLSPAYFPVHNDQNGTSNDVEDSPELVEENLSQTTNREALLKETTERRKNVTDMLKNRKDKKMSSKLSIDSQMLQLARDDLVFKKDLLQKMEQNDKDFKDGFSELNKTMLGIGAAIQQSVGILGQLVNQGMSNREIVNQPHIAQHPPFQQRYQSAIYPSYSSGSTVTNRNQLATQNYYQNISSELNENENEEEIDVGSNNKQYYNL